MAASGPATPGHERQRSPPDLDPTPERPGSFAALPPGGLPSPSTSSFAGLPARHTQLEPMILPPKLKDGGASPRVAPADLKGSPARRARSRQGSGSQSGLLSPSRANELSLSREHAKAWTSPRPLDKAPVKRGSLTVTVRTSAESSKLQRTGTTARVWCTLHGVNEAKTEEIELKRHSRYDFAAGNSYKFITKLNISTLGGAIEALSIRQDNSGASPDWHLSGVVVTEQSSGRFWDFEAGCWLRPADPESGREGQGTGTTLYDPVSVRTLEYQRAAGRISVGAKGTEIRLCGLNFVPFVQIDRYICALILFGVLLDIWREEAVRKCIADSFTTPVTPDSSGSSAGVVVSAAGSSCSWDEAAKIVYPATLVLDLLILLIFLLELIMRFTLKYWGVRNVFAYTLRMYNRRYRKVGRESFAKNARGVEFPWWRTIYNPANVQLHKEYVDNRSSDSHQQQRMPFNFLNDEYMVVIAYELTVVVLSLLIQSTYLAVAYSQHAQPGLPSEEGTWLEGLRNIGSILRIMRVSRILMRIKKLRSLSHALVRAFSGVMWIFVLVMVTTYAFAIVGVMAFKISDLDIVAQLVDAEQASEVNGFWGDMSKATKTLFFNVMLQDDLNSMLGTTSAGPAGNYIYLYVCSYLVLCTFLLMEAITGYIVQIISDKYTEQEAIDNMPFAAVARIEVAKWATCLGHRQPDDPKWLAPVLGEVEASLTTAAHVQRMLTKLTKVYDLEYVQMEQQPAETPSLTICRGGDGQGGQGGGGYPVSDWLIGVRSEAQLTHLLQFGFTYLSVDELDTGLPDVQEDLVIPVTREGEGELVQFTSVRPPLFSTEEDVQAAFAPYGIVMQVERERWDLPEDERNPALVRELEETLTMSWKVRLYRNEKPFTVAAIEEFGPSAQLQLRAAHHGELMVDEESGEECLCAAVEVYGQLVPLRPAHTYYLNRRAGDGGGGGGGGAAAGGGGGAGAGGLGAPGQLRDSVRELLGASNDSSQAGNGGNGGGVNGLAVTPSHGTTKSHRHPSSATWSGGGASSSGPGGQGALRTSLSGSAGSTQLQRFTGSGRLNFDAAASASASASAVGPKDLAGSAGAIALAEGFSGAVELQLQAMVTTLTHGRGEEERRVIVAALAQQAHAAVDRAARTMR